MSKTYCLVTDNGEMKQLIWDWHQNGRSKPEVKMFWESQEKFDAKVAKHTQSQYDMVSRIDEIYKEDYPDFLDDWDMVYVGFGRGQEKTYTIHIQKRETT
jgi:hypothetical protein